MSTRMQGIVKWFSSGGQSYGYINREDGGQIFVHYKNIKRSPKNAAGFLFLTPGQKVDFDVSDGYYCAGSQALNVEVIDDGFNQNL